MMKANLRVGTCFSSLVFLSFHGRKILLSVRFDSCGTCICFFRLTLAQINADVIQDFRLYTLKCASFVSKRRQHYHR
ncbi:unnamed protein product [Peronospora belbahrii]|uniref:Secreted protein n=1 Tax=Peronospora belbahrii TaxID=622444 RepID=A0AAU9KY89_9STRA|nr:unnamed protein product [Peronospora belbahrii]